MNKEQIISFVQKHWVKILIAIVVIYLLFRVGKRLAKPELTDPEMTGTVHTQINQQELQSTGNLSRPLTWYAAQADALQEAFWPWGGLWEYDDDAEEILKQCQTLEDVLMLISTYGVRGPGVIISDAKNLPATVQAKLDNSNKARVNEYYTSAGIDWQWV